MLIEFTVGNFASFREPVTLSMIAAPLRSRNKALDVENVIEVDKDLRLLTSVGVYGANASGKSSLVKAGAFMRQFVLGSFHDTLVGEPIHVEPFRLSTATSDQPSFFEIVFLLDGRQARYGFEANRRQVVSEWLYLVPSKREALIFERQGQALKVNPSNPEAREFRSILKLLARVNPERPLRDNLLFLSAAAQNNGPLALQVSSWFQNLAFMSGLDDLGFRAYSAAKFEEPQAREKMVALMRELDTGIRNISIERKNREAMLQNAPESLRGLLEQAKAYDPFSLKTHHQQFTPEGEAAGEVIFDLRKDESEGTKKLFYMSGPLVETLENGHVLWIDEMEARLHPNVTQAIVGLFNSREKNPRHAQLIFTTHATNLLDLDSLRRDQVWFVEKDATAASRLYSLADFKLRNDDASVEQDYLIGRYGAVPHIGELRGEYKADCQ